METKDLGKTSTGIQANVAGLLSYVLGWVTGLIFFLIEKENKFVRFHALQSIIVFGALCVFQIVIGAFMAIGLSFIAPLFSLVTSLVALLAVVLWILLMIKAYQGEMFKLPIAGDIAEKNTQK
jgi:uncharacterized membrane protein